MLTLARALSLSLLMPYDYIVLALTHVLVIAFLR